MKLKQMTSKEDSGQMISFLFLYLSFLIFQVHFFLRWSCYFGLVVVFVSVVVVIKELNPL